MSVLRGSVLGTFPYLLLVNSGHFFMVGGICVACAMFSGDGSHQDILVTKYFTYWTNTSYMSLMDMPRNKQNTIC